MTEKMYEALNEATALLEAKGLDSRRCTYINGVHYKKVGCILPCRYA